MGAHNNSYVFEAKDQREAIRKAEAFQRSEIIQYGNDAYGGHLGTSGIGVGKVVTQTFEIPSEAEKYILDRHDKWDRPWLARCGDNVWILAGWCAS
jgi:hypothetical protein